MSKNKSTKTTQFLRVLSVSALILGLSVLILAATNYLYWLLGGALTIGSLISIRKLQVTYAPVVDKSTRTELSNVHQENTSGSNVNINQAHAVYLGPTTTTKIEAKSPEVQIKEVSHSRDTGDIQPSLAAVCSLGPYKVDRGNYRKIALNVKKGDLVEGHLEEISGQDFDWYIADEQHLVYFINGDDRFNASKWGDSDVARKIRWTVRKDGPWYLIISTYGKQAAREVEVDLRLKAA